MESPNLEIFLKKAEKAVRIYYSSVQIWNDFNLNLALAFYFQKVNYQILRLGFFVIFQEAEIEVLKKKVLKLNELLVGSNSKPYKPSNEDLEKLSEENAKLQQENVKLKHRIAILKRVSFLFK